ncbi:uncharacterized protein LOC135481727 [Liolophura sinensis]|uniref:uncharacterized protein LOC135481727 n=1 Tax=Liolophura sinensis TaxID=3198878 RepID=UPI0031583745
MKFMTVKEREEALIFNVQGEGRLVVGPQRVFLFRERLEQLKLVCASQYQYLVMKDRFGMVTHKRGPCEMFHNPLEHDSVYVENAIKIDANHMIIVYHRVKQSVERSVIRGPAIFFPEAEEWLHKFVWHGSDPQDKARMIPSSRKFTQLAAIPDQFYYNVRDVRTTDDIIITVKLMIFYGLQDVITMLDTTHDPVADMINAVCADVIAYVGRRTYAQFLEQTDELSRLTTFPQLVQRTERVGFSVHKVVYRGYHATEQLQAMQTEAIEARTRLRLDAEIEGQRQQLVDYKLEKEQARTKLRQSMEESKQNHKQKVDGLKQAHELGMKQEEHKYQLEIEDKWVRARLDLQAGEQKDAEEHLRELHHLGVDMTKYMLSQQAAPVNEEVQFVGLDRKGS